MLDKTSQLSTVVCLQNSVSCECFVWFTDISSDRTVSVTNMIKEFKIDDKLDGQTYDGTLAKSGHLNGL